MICFRDHLSQQTVAADENRQLPIISDHLSNRLVSQLSRCRFRVGKRSRAGPGDNHHTISKGILVPLVSTPSNIAVLMLPPDNSLVGHAGSRVVRIIQMENIHTKLN
jgi:hypothetical protein